MNREDKDLLFGYLSMALPYDVCVHIRYKEGEPCYGKLTPRDIQWFIDSNIEVIKPYLRSMSSMTEEEDKQRIQLGIWRSSQTNGHEVTGIKPDIFQSYNSQAFQRAFNFLLKNHFDIFGLIPKGLAIAVTKENNPYNIMEE